MFVRSYYTNKCLKSREKWKAAAWGGRRARSSPSHPDASGRRGRTAKRRSRRAAFASGRPSAHLAAQWPACLLYTSHILAPMRQIKENIAEDKDTRALMRKETTYMTQVLSLIHI